MNLKTLKMTAMVNLISLVKLPLLAFVTPQILEMNEEKVEVKIRLDHRTRNHLGVMYFGALAMGAELSIATTAIDAIGKSGKRIDFIFKDFSCEFLKRADGHTHFVCPEASAVAELINKAAADKERHEHNYEGFAFVPSKGEQPVMKYRLTLSVKQRG